LIRGSKENPGIHFAETRLLITRSDAFLLLLASDYLGVEREIILDGAKAVDQQTQEPRLVSEAIG
jgi:hypothetical protein